MRRILVLRGGALGDFIVTLPALAALQHRWPSASIELIGNPTAAEIALRRGLIDRVHSQHDARWAALYSPADLPASLHDWLAGFDLVVNYWPDPDGQLAARFPRHAGQRFICGSAMPAVAPASRHYLSALIPLGVSEDAPAWVPLLNAQPAGCVRGPGTVAIHPGSGSRKKNWPASRWHELIRRIAEPVLLVVGEAEEAEWQASALSRTPVAPRLADHSLTIAARLPLEQLVAELTHCRLFIGHDSGISHLAAGCMLPSVLLFGPTDPAMWAPPANHVQVLRKGDDLAALSVDDVWDTLKGRLAPADRS